MVSSLSKALEWLRRGEPAAGEDEEEDDTEGGRLQQLLLLLQPPPPAPQLPPRGSPSLSGGTGSSPRSERTRLSGTLRPSFSSMSLRSGSGPSSMTFESGDDGPETQRARGGHGLEACGEICSPLQARGSTLRAPSAPAAP